MSRYARFQSVAFLLMSSEIELPEGEAAADAQIEAVARAVAGMVGSARAAATSPVRPSFHSVTVH